MCCHHETAWYRTALGDAADLTMTFDSQCACSVSVVLAAREDDKPECTRRVSACLRIVSASAGNLLVGCSRLEMRAESPPVPYGSANDAKRASEGVRVLARARAVACGVCDDAVGGVPRLVGEYPTAAPERREVSVFKKY